MGLLSIFKKKKKLSTYRSMYSESFFQITGGEGITFTDGTYLGSTKKGDMRTNKKPVQVWEQLRMNEEPVVDCTDLDQKIKIIKQRIKVLSDYTKTENLTEEYVVIGYLEARKKYNKYKGSFAYPTTNEALINALCKNHKVKLASLDQYSGTMPQEAIDELFSFKLSCRKIRKDIPVVRLIVPNTEEPEKKKRDPILLVSSPFGNWDYILGAWDKEVLIVDEIVYMGK